MPVHVQADKGGLEQLKELNPFKKNDENVSFKWDGANLRWTKVKGKMANDADMMVRPKIGAPYMVCLLGAATNDGHAAHMMTTFF